MAKSGNFQLEFHFPIRLGNDLWEAILAETENEAKDVPEIQEFLKDLMVQHPDKYGFDNGEYLGVEFNLTDFLLIKYPQYAVKVFKHCVYNAPGGLNREFSKILKHCKELKALIEPADLFSGAELSNEESQFFGNFISRFDYLVSTEKEDRAFQGHNPDSYSFLPSDYPFRPTEKNQRPIDFLQTSEKFNLKMMELRKKSIKTEQENQIKDAKNNLKTENMLMKRIQADILLSQAHKDETGKCGDLFVHSLHRRLTALEKYITDASNENKKFIKRGRQETPYTAGFLLELHQAFCREFETTQMNKNFFALVRALLNTLYKDLLDNFGSNLRVFLLDKQDSSIRRMINTEKEKRRIFLDSIQPPHSLNDSSDS